MSSDRPERRLRDILANVERIRRHVSGMTAERFMHDEKTQDAVERCLERIAEAARKLGDRLDDRYPNLDLPKLRRFGSVLRHDYDERDADLLWKMLVRRLGPLAAACREELASLDGQRLPPRSDTDGPNGGRAGDGADGRRLPAARAGWRGRRSPP